MTRGRSRDTPSPYITIDDRLPLSGFGLSGQLCHVLMTSAVDVLALSPPYKRAPRREMEMGRKFARERQSRARGIAEQQRRLRVVVRIAESCQDIRTIRSWMTHCSLAIGSLDDENHVTGSLHHSYI